MLNPKGISWAGFYAEQLEPLVRFYEEVVGFTVVEHNDHFCVMDAGEGALFEIGVQGKACASPKAPHQQSVIVGFLVDRLEPLVATLRARGLEPDSPIASHLGTRWVYYTDPEGNRFEFKDNNG